MANQGRVRFCKATKALYPPEREPGKAAKVRLYSINLGGPKLYAC